jgi:restriction system protein
VLETYEEIMQPLFLRFGGSEEELYNDRCETVAPPKARLQSLSDIVIEQVNVVGSAHRAATRDLENQILSYLFVQTPQFFEQVIIDLLLVMGYANRRRDLARQIGRSHDGGVDGVISQDPLGLDVILIQAKRLKPGSTVSSSQIRDFIGTLETKKAHKGIFVTTGDFSAFAKSAIERVSHRVRLISGRELSTLMVRHNLGVKLAQSYIFKEIDSGYFGTQAKLKTVPDKSSAIA